MEEQITISRSEYESMLERLKQLEVISEALKLSKGQTAYLNDQVAQLQRMLFGRTSERLVDAPGDQPDIDGLADILAALNKKEDPQSDQTENVPAHKRRKTRNKGKYKLDIPADLPREEVVIDVPEAERTMADGTMLVQIGEDRDEKLAYRPGGYFVMEVVRPKYAHPSDAALGVVQEPAANGCFKGSKVDESFAAHLAVDKYVLHLPLFRQLERLANDSGVKMTRQHASSILQQTGSALESLFGVMLAEVLNRAVIHTDETGVKMLDPGAGKCKNCKAWVYAVGGSDPCPYVVFDFTQGRQQQYLFDILKDYGGIVQADAYIAYENLEAHLPGVTWAACWAHARRKFEACLKGPSAELAAWVMRQIRYLFMFDRVAWKRTPAERLAIRQKHHQPIVDGLFAELKRRLIEDPLVLPKSKMAKAIAYLLKRPEAFRRYLTNPELRMDNNLAERHMRKVALGRKNWLFVGSHRAGRNMAILLSFAQTCRAAGANPFEWFEYVLRALPDWPPDRLAELLPDRWLASRMPQVVSPPAYMG